MSSFLKVAFKKGEILTAIKHPFYLGRSLCVCIFCWFIIGIRGNGRPKVAIGLSSISPSLGNTGHRILPVSSLLRDGCLLSVLVFASARNKKSIPYEFLPQNSTHTSLDLSTIHHNDTYVNASRRRGARGRGRRVVGLRLFHLEHDTRTRTRHDPQLAGLFRCSVFLLRKKSGRILSGGRAHRNRISFAFFPPLVQPFCAFSDCSLPPRTRCFCFVF